MKAIKISIILFISILFFSSCTDIIELDLKNTEPRIVIQANLNTTDSTFSANITMSNEFYENGDFKKVTGANVILKNGDGSAYTIPETEDGTYFLNNIISKPTDIFTVTVTDGEYIYKATTITPYPTKIELIYPAPFNPPGGGTSGANDGSNFYQITTLWKDSANIDNYYRIKNYVNNEFEANNYALSDDRFGDGDTIASVMIAELYSGDTFKLELLSTDKQYFDYFYDIAILYSRGPGGTTPYNPKGNFNNGALGYFGIYSVSAFEFTLP